MTTPPLSSVVPPPLDKKDFDNILEDYECYKQDVQEDSTALTGCDFECLLQSIKKLQEHIDFQQKVITA